MVVAREPGSLAVPGEAGLERAGATYCRRDKVEDMACVRNILYQWKTEPPLEVL